MAKLINPPSLAIAIGAPARARLADNLWSLTMSASSTLSTISIKAIKASPELACYFGRLSLSELADNAFRKGASLEAFAAGLSGALCEFLVSGSDHGVKALRVLASSETKGRAPKLCRVALAYFEGFKPGKLTVASMDEAETLLSGHHAEFLAILTPDSAKPKAPAINWKQECINARAERDAAMQEVAALKAVAEKLTAKLAHVQALAKAQATEAAEATEATSA